MFRSSARGLPKWCLRGPLSFAATMPPMVADALKGQIPVAFAVVKDPARVATPELVAAMRKEVMDTVDRELGAIARPGAVHFVTVLPKTRSGKLLRRSIQALAEGRDPGDLTTIEDPSALEQIRNALAGR